MCSELSLAVDAAKKLHLESIAVRVVSVPSWELFEEQSIEYKEAVLPKSVTARIAIEAASSFGWERYTGPQGTTITIDHFGASAPAKVLFCRASALQGLGRTNDALDCLERITSHGRWYFEWAKNDSDFAPLRGHPRFEALINKG